MKEPSDLLSMLCDLFSCSLLARTLTRTGVAVITKPDLNKATQVEVKKKVEWEGNWRVLLHRDEWYTFDYCEGALLHVIPVLTRKKVNPFFSEVPQRGALLAAKAVQFKNQKSTATEE